MNAEGRRKLLRAATDVVASDQHSAADVTAANTMASAMALIVIAEVLVEMLELAKENA